jgi:hypothetical protein
LSIEDIGTGNLEQYADRQRVAELEAQILRFKSDADYHKSRANAAEKRAVEAGRIREHVFGLKSTPIIAPAWATERSEASGAPHIPLLFGSDFQWGETIDPANMDGINAFDVAIAEARYRTVIERTIDISFEHLPKNKYNGIVYLRGGDMISGDIHEELRETNELSAIPAVRSLVQAETWGIRQLADAFGRVHVISVPGNHGRYQKKPPTKRISDNYDTMSAWWLEDIHRADSRFTWQTAGATDAVFDLHGRLYLATHGDNIGSSGGQGFIGPAATIMRGMKKTMDEYARRGVALSKMFVGHFHTAYDLGYGWSNGSLPGYSDYARSYRMTPEPPVQWLLFFHPRYGATSQWKIQLAPEAHGTTASRPLEVVA